MALRTFTRTVPERVARSPVRVETSARTAGRGPKRPTTRATGGEPDCAASGPRPEAPGPGVEPPGPGVGPPVPGGGVAGGSGGGVGVGSGVGDPSRPMSRGLNAVSTASPIGPAMAPHGTSL